MYSFRPFTSPAIPGCDYHGGRVGRSVAVWPADPDELVTRLPKPVTTMGAKGL